MSLDPRRNPRIPGTQPDRDAVRLERSRCRIESTTSALDPAPFPPDVLEEMRDEFVDHHGAGLALIEMSHRSAEYDAVHQEARRLALEVFGAPEDFDVLFIQGGAILQFAMVAMNLLRPGRRAGYVNTGAWAKGAIADARHYGEVYTAWDGAAEGYAAHPGRRRDRGARRDALPPHHLQRDHRRYTISGVSGGGCAARRRHVVGADGATHPLGPVRPRLRRRAEEPRSRRHGDGLHPQVGRLARQRIHRPLPALRHPHRQGVAVQHPPDVHHRDGRQGAEVDEGEGGARRHRARGGGEGGRSSTGGSTRARASTPAPCTPPPAPT